MLNFLTLLKTIHDCETPDLGGKLSNMVFPWIASSIVGVTPKYLTSTFVFCVNGKFCIVPAAHDLALELIKKINNCGIPPARPLLLLLVKSLYVGSSFSSSQETEIRDRT